MNLATTIVTAISFFAAASGSAFTLFNWHKTLRSGSPVYRSLSAKVVIDNVPKESFVVWDMIKLRDECIIQSASLEVKMKNGSSQSYPIHFGGAVSAGPHVRTGMFMSKENILSAPRIWDLDLSKRPVLLTYADCAGRSFIVHKCEGYFTGKVAESCGQE